MTTADDLRVKLADLRDESGRERKILLHEIEELKAESKRLAKRVECAVSLLKHCGEVANQIQG